MIAAGATAVELIPGDPREPEALAAELDRYAHGADEAAARLNALDGGMWVGEAADAFRARLGELPARLSRGTEAFGNSARALRHYAEELRAAQATAGHVAELAAQARQQSAAHERQVADYQAAVAAGAPAGPAPPPVDPGAETMAAAEQMLAAARERVDGAARFATNVLQAQAEQAPDQRSIWESVWHHLSEFGKGFAEASWGLLKFTYHSSPIYAAVDPGGFVEHYQNLGQGIAYGVTHPVAFAKAVADWETFKESPARWLGHLGPSLLAALATGGAGVATRGLRGMRAAKRLEDVAGGPGKRLASRVPDGTQKALHAGSADPATRKKLFEREYRDVKGVNAERLATGKPGHKMNCSRCVAATDTTLAGSPASAMPSEATKLSVVEKHFGGHARPQDSYGDIVEEMENAGEGSRGVVAGTRKQGPGHVFNVVHDRNGVVFIDGQRGDFAYLEDFDKLFLIRTN